MTSEASSFPTGHSPAPRIVPQVVESEIRNLCFYDRGAPSGIGYFPADRFAAKRKAVHRMFAALGFEHGDRIAISQRSRLESQMSPDQIAKAEALAAAWKPKAAAGPSAEKKKN